MSHMAKAVEFAAQAERFLEEAAESPKFWGNPAAAAARANLLAVKSTQAVAYASLALFHQRAAEATR